MRRWVRISRTKPSITEDAGRARVVASDVEDLGVSSPPRAVGSRRHVR